MQLMRDAGLAVMIDPAGNLVGLLEGSDPSRKPLLIGSHIDSVPEGGSYDGDVGSLSAIEVAKILNESGIKLHHPLQGIIFQNEEGGVIGSHILAAGFDDKLLNMKSQSGKTVREGIEFIGGDLSKLAEAQRQPGTVSGYFELHIEQGAVQRDARAGDLGARVARLGRDRQCGKEIGVEYPADAQRRWT